VHGGVGSAGSPGIGMGGTERGTIAALDLDCLGLMTQG
jgi:hypothetical protein